jgi:parallel beta-helix repeat protein
MKRAIVFACIVLCAQVCLATTIHVPADQPTIQAGINAAINGDTVLVAPGNYYERLSYHGKRVAVLSSAGPDVTRLSCYYVGQWIVEFVNSEDSLSILDGFRLDGENNLSGVVCYGASPTIRNCVIMRCSRGGINCNLSSPLVQNCEIRDCAVNGIKCINSRAKIVGNWIHDCESDAIGAAVGGTGAICPEITHNLIENCSASIGSSIGFYDSAIGLLISHNLIRNNSSWGDPEVDGAIFVNGTNCRIFNNTLVGNSGGIRMAGGAASIVTNNILISNARSGITPSSAEVDYNNILGSRSDNDPGPHGISIDPKFLSADLGDYRLQVTSPCVDAGNPDPSFNDPDGSRSDMGAFRAEWNRRPIATEMGFGDGMIDDQLVVPVPTIFWHFQSSTSSEQVGFEIEVSTDRNWSTGKLWDSGPILSTDTSVVYAGQPLAGTKSYFLRMRVSDASGWGDWTYIALETHLSRIVHVPTERPSIMRGIETARDGDTVLVEPGEYHETIDFHGKHIVVRSNGEMGSTVIVGLPDDTALISSAVIFHSGEDSTSILEGFTLRGGLISRAILCQGASPVIQHCEVSGYQSGAIYCLNSAAKIRHNWIHDNYASKYASGVGGTTSLPLEMSHNLFERNRGMANINVSGRNCLVCNNVIVSGGAGVALADGRDCRVINNAIAHNSGRGIFSTAAFCDYNLVWANGADYGDSLVRGPHDISADPLFVDTIAHDYSLLCNSPCIDAGYPSVTGFSGHAIDIGAHEFEYLLGNANADEGSATLNIADAVFLVNYVFLGGEAPCPLGSSEVNCDGSVDVADIVYLLNYLFNSGPAPCAVAG